MKVEIWSDVVCPWCYIGKRRFEAALERFEHRDQVEVVWRSFELDPSMDRDRAQGLTEHLAAKYGTSVENAAKMQDRMAEAAAGEGVTMRFDLGRTANTFDAHRVIHLGAARGVQDAVKERLMRAYFTEGEQVADVDTLVRLASDAGLDAAETREVLAGDTYADAVRAEEAEAHALGVQGVPFFVVDRRFGVSGAQSADLLLEAMTKAWDESHTLTPVGASRAGDDGEDGCADGSCGV